MVKISDDKWEQIKHYFNYLCDDKLLICPNCGMPYKEGYICESCGADNSTGKLPLKMRYFSSVHTFVPKYSLFAKSSSKFNITSFIFTLFSYD